MADLSEGFIGLPGGYGTLEEVRLPLRLARTPRDEPRTDSPSSLAQVAEMTTWSQIGVHLKRASSLFLCASRASAH